MSEQDEETPYGFAWGPMRVTRLAKMPDGRRVVGIDTGQKSQRLEVYASPTGKRLRVFRDGRELR